MRLDKYISNNTSLSRKDVAKQVKLGNILINGKKAKSPDEKIDENSSQITLNGKVITYSKYVYFMLNKPQGVVSATTDLKQKTVLDLLPSEYKKLGLFPCGRLDKDTVGLVILTNNGVASHKLLSPKSGVEKTYLFQCADDILESDIKNIEQGILLRDGYVTKPCKIVLSNKKEGKITITEGKYHEIKRMFGATGNKVTFLKRISFGKIILDEQLKEGEYRPLTMNEVTYFER